MHGRPSWDESEKENLKLSVKDLFCWEGSTDCPAPRRPALGRALETMACPVLATP